MSNYELTLREAENYQATSAHDGFGKSKSPDGKILIKIFLKVRRDSQIPEFDMITECKWCEEKLANGSEESYSKYNEKISELLSENGGMFVEDALKLKEKDIFSMLGENVHPKDAFILPGLRALKKAIVNYFEKTGQKERLRKATETVICHCRHVTDIEIQEAMEKGHDTLEALSIATGAGTGCNTCINKVMEIVAGRKKTAFGEIK